MATEEDMSRFFAMLALPDTEEKLSVSKTYNLTEFTCFGRFPIEIRLAIWEMNLPEGRIIQINVDENLNIIGSRAPAPVNLHVCQESRNEALKYFSVMKENFLNKPVYFRPEIDTIYFHTELTNGTQFLILRRPLTALAKSELGLIQTLIVKDSNVLLTAHSLRTWLRFIKLACESKRTCESQRTCESKRTADALIHAIGPFMWFKGLKTVDIKTARSNAINGVVANRSQIDEFINRKTSKLNKAFPKWQAIVDARDSGIIVPQPKVSITFDWKSLR